MMYESFTELLQDSKNASFTVKAFYEILARTISFTADLVLLCAF